MKHKEELDLFLKKFFKSIIDKILWRYNAKKRQLIIICPHEYFQDFLNQNYIKKLRKNLKERYNIQDIILKTNRDHFLYGENLNFPFNQNFTFDNYFYSNETESTIKLIKEVIRKKNKYNPVIIYGEKNAGKTHILHAIGNFYITHLNKDKILFLDFKNINFLFRKYSFEDLKKIKIFIVDHLEYYNINNDKENILLKTIKYFLNRNVKIFFSTKNRLENIVKSKELFSLLMSGIIFNLRLPDFNTRIEFIRHYTNKNNMLINENQIFDLALKHKDIGSIKKELNNILTIGTTKRDKILKKIQNKTPQNIIKLVSKQLNITEKDLLSKNNKKHISLARHIAIYLCRDIFKLSTKNLEKIFNRNHSTILYSIKKINKLKKEDENVNKIVNELYKKCNL